MSMHVAVQHRAERGVVDQFKDAKATSADTARPLEPGSRGARAAWRRLERRGVIRQAGGGRFYLDRRRLDELDQRKRVILAAVIGVVVVGMIVQLILSRP